MMKCLERYNIDFWEMFTRDIKYTLNEDPNTRDRNGITVLQQYVINHDFDREVMQNFINRGADLEMRNKTGKTAFLLAVVHRQKEFIDFFIENGANINIKDFKEHNALHYMAVPELNYRFGRVEPYFEVQEEDRFNFDDIYSILEILLKLGIDVNATNYYGDTPLMWAARGDNLRTVQMLIAFGANVNLRNRRLRTCLHFTCTYDAENHVNVKRWNNKDDAILSELIQNKACVNCFDDLDRSSLLCIVFFGHRNSFYFAEKLILMTTLVNWRKRIDFFLGETILLGQGGRLLELSNYAEKCYCEIDLMKDCKLPGESNMCLFTLNGVPEENICKAPEIYDKALEILLKKKISLYSNLIISRIGRKYLRKKAMELTISTRGENQDVVLKQDTVYIILPFLDNIEIFNLILASL